MNKLIFVLILLLYSFSFGQKMNGISINGEKFAPDFSNFSYFKKSNANWVSIQSFGFIKSPSSGIDYDRKNFWHSQTFEGTIDYIKAAKKSGFNILLKPHTIVEFEGSWSGNFNLTKNDDWEKLEETYSKYILILAKIAEESKVEAMSIGVEIDNFAKKRKVYFLKLIEKVRKIYSGKLTYCSNWDYYTGITFWRELDFIGVDAYFNISKNHTPKLEECVKNLKPIVESLKRVSTYFKKPIVFTEFGFQSRNYAGYEPWNWEGNKTTEVNVVAQDVCYQAVFKSFWNEPWFLGGFSWKWHLDFSKSGGNRDNSYTPQNKPAEKTISSFYLSS